MAPHVITLPNWFIGLRGFQLLFALVVLGISADGVSFIPFNVCPRSIDNCFEDVSLLIELSLGVSPFSRAL